MIDQSVLDGQKIKYHTELLEKWLAGEEIWPVYFEVGPTAACNNRCVFCAYSYMEHSARYIDAERLLDSIGILAEHGAKSCMFAGEGEPMLHPKLPDFVGQAHDLGIDVAITSNFLAANEGLLDSLLGNLEWIRCSLNATSSSEYELIHKGGANGFDKVLRNLEYAAQVRDRDKLKVTLGVQCIVLAENIDGLAGLAKRLADIGVNYFSLKPCIAHPQMEYQPSPISDEQWGKAIADVREAGGDSLSVIARDASRDCAVGGERGYDHCLALPLFAEIISDGRVFSCGPMLGNDEFCYGNIHEQRFDEIWQGERRREICRHAAEELDVRGCMPSCRLHQVNRFLWSLKHPPEHVNFI